MADVVIDVASRAFRARRRRQLDAVLAIVGDNVLDVDPPAVGKVSARRVIRYKWICLAEYL